MRRNVAAASIGCSSCCRASTGKLCRSASPLQQQQQQLSAIASAHTVISSVEDAVATHQDDRQLVMQPCSYFGY
jgi:hypothetical protein